MIQIAIWKNSFSEVRALEVKGHAGQAPYGKDIVCAAVSALTQTAVLALEKEVKEGFELKKRQGYIYLEITTKNRKEKEKAVLILSTICFGLEEIGRDYQSYVSVEYKTMG